MADIKDLENQNSGEPLTISQLLDKDTIKQMASELVDEASNIGDLIIIYSRDDKLHWLTNGVLAGRAVSLLEQIKFDILRQIYEE